MYTNYFIEAISRVYQLINQRFIYFDGEKNNIITFHSTANAGRLPNSQANTMSSYEMIHLTNNGTFYQKTQISPEVYVFRFT